MFLLLTIDKVRELLKNTDYEHFINLINNQFNFEFSINQPLYKVEYENRNYSLKIREKNNIAVIDLEKIISIMKDEENFLLEYYNPIIKDNYIILVSDWLNGFQPIKKNREDLPEYFSHLARFNKQNPANNFFTSMYVDFIAKLPGAVKHDSHFDDIKELIKYETDYHIKNIQNIMETGEIINILNKLENGFSCIILEDINTGNFFKTNEGIFKFLDIEYIYNGLNLYQFDKINYFNFEGTYCDNLSISGKEAKECYSAYFDTFEIKKDEANEQIRAIELLKVLRDNSKLRLNGYNKDEEILSRINLVKGIDKFI